MRLLLDTHILIWALEEDPMLPKEARFLLTSRSSQIFVSVASIWEMAIKSGSGKLKMKSEDFESDMQAFGAELLPIQLKHCHRIQTMPDIHRDPFDRMLIAQSELEHMQLLTNDARLTPYGPQIRLV